MNISTREQTKHKWRKNMPPKCLNGICWYQNRKPWCHWKRSAIHCELIKKMIEIGCKICEFLQCTFVDQCNNDRVRECWKHAGHCLVCCARSMNDVIMTSLAIIQRAQSGQAFGVLWTSTNVHCTLYLIIKNFYVRFQSILFIYLFSMNRATFPLTSRLPILTSTDQWRR